VRRLLTRLTATSCLVAALLSAGLGIALKAPWALILFRALLAAAIVALAGGVAALILMRTALRRYYEQGRTTVGAARLRDR
jgi:multisubunit Na+/H+ antiporter MnhG subunit